jgi:hypothetical protein
MPNYQNKNMTEGIDLTRGVGGSPPPNSNVLPWAWAPRPTKSLTLHISYDRAKMYSKQCTINTAQMTGRPSQ